MIKKSLSTEYKELAQLRDSKTHKGYFGVAGIVGGSVCYQGAACLATKAALHSGAGIVTSFVPNSVYLPLASKVYGAVIETLDEQDGCINDMSIIRRVTARKCTAVLCGSGLGLTRGSMQTVHLVSQLDLPIVYDGDALTLISGDLSILERNKPTVLTAHVGEFSRLCGLDHKTLTQDREQYALEFAKEHNVYVVLKDYVTVVACPDETVYVLDKPTSALSKGGSGDVLAGMLTSFLAQGIEVEKAVVYAVTLHNACGHECGKKLGEYYTQPENIIESISELI